MSRLREGLEVHTSDEVAQGYGYDTRFGYGGHRPAQDVTTENPLAALSALTSRDPSDYKPRAGVLIRPDCSPVDWLVDGTPMTMYQYLSAYDPRSAGIIRAIAASARADSIWAQTAAWASSNTRGASIPLADLLQFLASISPQL